MSNGRIVTIRDLLDTQCVFVAALCAAGHPLTTESKIDKRVESIIWTVKGPHHSASIALYPHGFGTNETAELNVEFSAFGEFHPRRDGGPKTDKRQWKMVEGEKYGVFMAAWNADKDTVRIPDLLARIIAALSAPMPVRNQ